MYMYRFLCFIETPLTAAAVKNNANEVIMFLINGGAYFDFKNRSGLTAVHKAAIAGNSHNIKVKNKLFTLILLSAYFGKFIPNCDGRIRFSILFNISTV